MTHDGGNTLKSQDHREGPGALPLKSMECKFFGDSVSLRSSLLRAPQSLPLLIEFDHFSEA